MFKRSTKLTALLVAAASVMSTVPAMASTKLANKEGTVENAVAFKDGKYLYEGYRTDDDDNGLYYNAGEKDKKLDDADALTGASFTSVNKFDDKYVSAFDGNDEYVIDMSTGKISDDDTYTDNEETAETKLVNKLKKTDRYGSGTNATITGKVDGSKFADVWYEYTATTTGTGAVSGVQGYTNASGTYIDCSYDVNIYAYADGKMTKIENVGDTENGIKLNSISHFKTLGQDDKYIYRIITAELTGEKTVNGNAASTTTAYYVQKVSKAQGDKEGDAYLPKSTDTYEIALKTKLGNGDVEDAYKALIATGAAGDFENVKYAIVDGAIYATYNDSNTKVKTYKILLKTSEKLDQTYSSTKIGAHVAKKDADKDQDIVKAKSWAVDVNGTVWALDKGVIKKSVKCGDFETVYTCDRSLNSIDVYDENNLIAWDDNGDVYTTVTEGSTAAKDEAEEIVGENPATPAVTGWVQAADGTWTFLDATGAKVTGWVNVGGVWYFMDKTTAVMKTGWVLDGSTWYYTNASGAMQTGWVNVGGTWYYLQSSGAMKTGWLNDNGTWYYLNANGSMAANTTVDGYVLNASGAWVK